MAAAPSKVSAASTPTSPTPGSGPSAAFFEELVEHWKAMIDTNVLGAALSIRAVLGHFKEQEGDPSSPAPSPAGAPCPVCSTRPRSSP